VVVGAEITMFNVGSVVVVLVVVVGRNMSAIFVVALLSSVVEPDVFVAVTANLRY
jgi:hypothetical protein